ncbi:hypothetical protein QUA42_26075 [Microcoleus sp. Pol11C2]|uniref:hypothetical protein n=1 Tax=Microcoleus sp. Pol11C2 TaxID=3055389 RepID=UPI002FCF671E
MTATTDRPLKHFCIEDLKSADLAGITLISQLLTLRLYFTLGTGIYDTSIELYQLIHQVISQPVNSDSEESCFWVGNAELRQLTEDKSQTLSTLPYPFQNQAGLVETGSSPLFYFRLEGGIYIEVVWGSYKIFQELESAVSTASTPTKT